MSEKLKNAKQTETIKMKAVFEWNITISMDEHITRLYIFSPSNLDNFPPIVKAAS